MTNAIIESLLALHITRMNGANRWLSLSTNLCDGVQLVKEEHARGGRPRLVKYVPHVGLRLSEPHGQQLGPLDGDKVGLALVGNGLG